MLYTHINIILIHINYKIKYIYCLDFVLYIFDIFLKYRKREEKNKILRVVLF